MTDEDQSCKSNTALHMQQVTLHQYREIDPSISISIVDLDLDLDIDLPANPRLRPLPPQE